MGKYKNKIFLRNIYVFLKTITRHLSGLMAVLTAVVNQVDITF